MAVPPRARLAAQRHDIALALELRGLRLLEVLFETLEAAFGHAEVGEDQLVFHRLRVTRRIDRACRMGNGGIPKRAQDVNERIGVLVRDDVDERLCAGA